MTMNSKTMKAISLWMMMSLSAMLMTSCEQNLLNDEEEESSGVQSKLSIHTRSTATDVPYPVTVGVFKSDGTLVSSQTIATASDPLSFELTAGSYRLVALAGTTGYVIPQPLSLTTAITLQDENHTAATALMTGGADVKITTANASADVTLSYAVARAAITLTDVPTDVTAVSVSFSPQYGGMALNGTYSDGGKVASVNCVKDEVASTGTAATWKTTEFYLLPGSGQQTTLSIAMTDGKGQSSTYGYTHTSPLAAATPYVLTGSYLHGFTLDGTLKVAGWNDLVEIGFQYGGTANSDPTESDEAVAVADIPETGTIWNGACVAGVNSTAFNEATVLLMSITEWNSLTPTELAEAVTAYSLPQITGTWRLPTDSEVATLRSVRTSMESISEFDDFLTAAGGTVSSASAYYLCKTTGGTFLKYKWGGETQPAELGTSTTFRARAVKSVKVKVQESAL